MQVLVSLDQKKAHCPIEKVEALRFPYIQVSKTYRFGKGSGAEKQFEAYRGALSWFWTKYIQLMGGERPTWSYPVPL